MNEYRVFVTLEFDIEANSEEEAKEIAFDKLTVGDASIYEFDVDEV